MSDGIIQACARCGGAKPNDGYIFCGGSYCLHDDMDPKREDDRPFDPMATIYVKDRNPN
jgi:hypothetical protein